MKSVLNRLEPLRRQLQRLPRPVLPGGARLWITLASGGFLLAALAGHGRQLLQLSLDGQGWCWLLLALGLTLLSLLGNALAWGVCLRWLGYRPRWSAAAVLFLISNLRKYLPGGVWHLLSRVRALKADPGAEAPSAHQPLGTAQALVAVLLDPLLAAVAALALVPLGGWQAGLGLLCLLPLLALLPRWLNPLMQRLEQQRAHQLADRGLLQEGIEELPPILPGYPWQPLLAELGFVLLRFSGFACCVQAFDLAFSIGWGGWLAGFALAWTAGLVVPGAPGGLGVFEAVLLLRLATVVPEAPLLAVAISYRLVSSLADLLAALTARADLAAVRNRSYC
jgi:uncharacterized membrane protein YbhN (UPF0104 family)